MTLDTDIEGGFLICGELRARRLSHPSSSEPSAARVFQVRVPQWSCPSRLIGRVDRMALTPVRASERERDERALNCSANSPQTAKTSSQRRTALRVPFGAFGAAQTQRRIALLHWQQYKKVSRSFFFLSQLVLLFLIKQHSPHNTPSSSPPCAPADPSASRGFGEEEGGGLLTKDHCRCVLPGQHPLSIGSYVVRLAGSFFFSQSSCSGCCVGFGLGLPDLLSLRPNILHFSLS